MPRVGAAGRVIVSLSFRNTSRERFTNQEGGFHESRKSFDPASRLVPVLGGPADRDDGDPPGARAREDEEIPHETAGHRRSGQLLHRRRAEGDQVRHRAAAQRSQSGVTPSQITIGQMYVQFQVPASKKQNMSPVIMVHGSSHTGACLESTPDGREGWEPYFVRHGISTYVVDQAGRGRSGFDESVIHEAAAMIKGGDVQNGTALIPGFGRITDSGAWTAWFGHLQPPGLHRPDWHADPARGSGRSADRRRQSQGRLLPGISARERRSPASSRGPGPSMRRPQDPTTTMRSTTTSSWFPTRKSRCRAPRVRAAIRRRSLPPTPGPRRIWRRW